MRFHLEYHNSEFHGRSLHTTKEQRRERRRAKNATERDVMHEDRASLCPLDILDGAPLESDATERLAVFRALLAGAITDPGTEPDATERLDVFQSLLAG